jgi:DNA-binding NarL/FixJ family response regulator
VFVRKFIEEFGISMREKEIIELIMQGKTNNDIENTLFISFNTVKNHIYNIYKKTGVNSRTQLLYMIKKYSDNVI